MEAAAKLYVALAQGVLMLHLAFVAWGLFGAAFTRGRRWATRLHVTTLIYGVLITWADVFSQGRVECPLTWLENRLLQEGGVAPHQTWFLMRLLLWIGRPSMHPEAIPTWGLAAATLGVAVLNLSIHWRRATRLQGETAGVRRLLPGALRGANGAAAAGVRQNEGYHAIR